MPLSLQLTGVHLGHVATNWLITAGIAYPGIPGTLLLILLPVAAASFPDFFALCSDHSLYEGPIVI